MFQVYLSINYIATFCNLMITIENVISYFPGLLMSSQENMNIFKRLKLKQKSIKQYIFTSKMMILPNYILKSGITLPN